jgi:hypothetical protein
VFLLDDEFDQRILCVIDAWPMFGGKMVVRTPKHEFMATGSWGNTFNTMEGYRYAEMIAHGGAQLRPAVCPRFRCVRLLLTVLASLALGGHILGAILGATVQV